MPSQATRSLYPSTWIVLRGENPGGRVEGAGGLSSLDKDA